jgi:hypothetical protein
MGLQGDTLLESLIIVGLYGAAVSFVKGYLTRGRARYAWYCVALTAIAPIVMRGTRHPLLFALMPLILVLWTKLRESQARAQVLRWLIGAVLLAGLLQVQLAVRASGWDALRYVNIDAVTEPNATGQFHALLFAEYLVPDHHEYFMEAVEPFFLFHWMPRKLWPGKPTMQSWEYYNTLATNNSRNWNVTPSVIGQYFMNWGIAGVVAIGCWLGSLTSLTDRLFRTLNTSRQQAMVGFIGMVYAFIIASFRFYAPFYAAYVVIGFGCTLLLTCRITLPSNNLLGSRRS